MAYLDAQINAKLDKLLQLLTPKGGETTDVFIDIRNELSRLRIAAAEATGVPLENIVFVDDAKSLI